LRREKVRDRGGRRQGDQEAARRLLAADLRPLGELPEERQRNDADRAKCRETLRGAARRGWAVKPKLARASGDRHSIAADGAYSSPPIASNSQ
jgi:hypothetical protein